VITELSFTNFKSWKSVEKMRLAPITGLFGTNSSGKTSVLQLLLMLKQTIESTDRAQVLAFGDEKSLTNLGSFRMRCMVMGRRRHEVCVSMEAG